MALLDDLNVGHQFLGPLDRPGTDEEDGAAKGQPENQVAGADLTEHRHVHDGGDVDGDVGDDEYDNEDHRQGEHARDLSLRSAGGLGIGVCHARLVLDGGHRQVAGLDRAVGAVIGLRRKFRVDVVAHRALIPIHTAAAIRAANTTVHMNKPSTTGPSRPRDMPPGLDASWSESM